MTDKRIMSLANGFRKRIDQAKKNNYFINSMLEEFPVQCCGVTSSLLAEFFRGNGIDTLWISSEQLETRETHAWLVVKDDRINAPRFCFDDVPNSVVALLNSYGNNNTERRRGSTRYEEQDIKNGLIIDITGDQFGEPPVYVGYMDRFHKQFDFISAYEHDGLFAEELIELYEIIMTQQ